MKVVSTLHSVDDLYLRHLTEQIDDLERAKIITSKLLRIGRLSPSQITNEFCSYFINRATTSPDIGEDTVDKLYDAMCREISNYTKYEIDILVERLLLDTENVGRIRLQLRQFYQSQASQVARRQNITSLNEFLSVLKDVQRLLDKLDEFSPGDGTSLKDIIVCNSRCLDSARSDFKQELKTFLINDQWISCPALVDPDHLKSLPEFKFLDALPESADQTNEENSHGNNDIIFTNTTLFILRSLGKFTNCAIYADRPFFNIKCYICDTVEFYCAVLLKFFVDEFCPQTFKTSPAFQHLSRILNGDEHLSLPKEMKQRLLSDSLSNLQTRVIAVESVHTLQRMVKKLPLNAITDDFSREEFEKVLMMFDRYYECLQAPVYYGAVWWAFDSTVLLNKQKQEPNKVLSTLNEQLDRFVKLFELTSPPISNHVRVILLELIIDRLENHFPGSDRTVRVLFCNDIKRRIYELKQRSHTCG